MNFDVSQLGPLAVKYGIPLFGALIVFWIGRMIAGKVYTGSERMFNRGANSDPSLSRFFASILKYLVLVAAIIAALTILGIDTSGLTAAIAGLGAAMAFVLQGSLSNLAAGVMLMIFRPFKVGDEIKAADASGKVKEIGMTATRLTTVDNKEVIIANGKIWGGTIENNSSLGDRRMDMVFGINYNADIDKAIKVITDAARAHPAVQAEPAPWAKVVNLNESSVDIELRAWCKSGDYKGLKVSISQPVKAALDKAGIGIPYPHGTKIKQSVKHSKARDRLARLKSLRNS